MRNVEQRILKLVAKRDLLKEEVAEAGRLLTVEEERRMDLLKARELLISFASHLQSDFKTEVDSLLTLAVRSVFDDREYEFKLDFKERKDRAEVTPLIISGRIDLIPNKEMGRGALPVMGFPLRVVLLDGSRRMIWLDEPLKGALGRTDELFFRAIKMFKEVSERAGIQVIVNTHEEDFIELADTAYRLRHDGEKTISTRIKPRKKVIRRGE